jgi:hypothetical protein
MDVGLQKMEAELLQAKETIFGTVLQAFCGSTAAVDAAATESELRDVIASKLPGTEAVLSCVAGSDAEKREQAMQFTLNYHAYPT